MEDFDTQNRYTFDRLELHELDLLQDEECYYKAIKELKPDYVIHTACPFFTEVAPGDEKQKQDVKERIKRYRNSSRLLAKSACMNGVKKVIMTGAATSVIGPKPKQIGSYKDSFPWADQSQMTRPNELAKLVAERAVWDEILRQQAAD